MPTNYLGARASRARTGGCLCLRCFALATLGFRVMRSRNCAFGSLSWVLPVGECRLKAISYRPSAGEARPRPPKQHLRLQLAPMPRPPMPPATLISFPERVYKIINGVLLRVAGFSSAPGYAGDGGPATSATLSDPARRRCRCVRERLHRGYREQPYPARVSNGTIVTIAGTGAFGYTGDGGAATSATLANPTGVAVDAAGNVYVADSRTTPSGKYLTSA